MIAPDTIADALISPPLLGIALALSVLMGFCTLAGAFILRRGFQVRWVAIVPITAVGVIFGWRAWAIYTTKAVTTSGLIVIVTIAFASFVCMIELLVQWWAGAKEREAEVTLKAVESAAIEHVQAVAAVAVEQVAAAIAQPPAYTPVAKGQLQPPPSGN